MTRPVASGALSPQPTIDLNVKNLPTRRQHHDPQIVAAAQGMEALFLDYMMKVMRETVPKNEMSMENPATEIYRGMLDSEIAQTAARTQSVGLADQIIDYLDPPRYTENRNRPANLAATTTAKTGMETAGSTGGTHEGQ